MNTIKEQLSLLKAELPSHCTLIAVSKTKPDIAIETAYAHGQRDFGENKVQELIGKAENLPKDINWHMIGHLQRNKVKYIAPFVHLIHGVDTEKLLREINKQGKKNDRIIECLLQIHIAKEESKFGFSEEEVELLFQSEELGVLENVRIIGLMGMATNSDDTEIVSSEFSSLKQLYDKLAGGNCPSNVDLKVLSMGMSGDYKIALAEGSTMVRIGSSIFGSRN